MIESMLAVLPDPDSPTTPNSFPGATEKLTPSTARTSPASVKNEVRSDLTSSSGFTWRSAYHRPAAAIQTDAAGRWAVLMNADDDEPRRRTKEVMSQNAMAPDGQEGIGAFLKKRKPIRRGK
jgi:hypothetical protein